LQKSQEGDCGLFYYLSARLSGLFHPDCIEFYDYDSLNFSFPLEIARNIKNEISLFNLSIFDEKEESFLDFFYNFVLSEVNFPFYTLISSIDYTKKNGVPNYNECDVASVLEFAEITEKDRSYCREILRKIILEIWPKRIFVVSTLEGNRLAETMQNGIFLDNQRFNDFTNITKEREKDPLFLNLKCYLMVLLCHELCHYLRYEIAPQKSTLFMTPRKNTFAGSSIAKEFEIGESWELFIANKRIFFSDFAKDKTLYLTFLKKENWKKDKFTANFEKHNEIITEIKQKNTNYSDENENSYRCTLCAVN